MHLIFNKVETLLVGPREYKKNYYSMLVSGTFRKVIQISTEGVLFYGPENCQKKIQPKNATDPC
jgi:hypothetical protein